MKSIYNIPVTWMMQGTIKVEAESVEEAIELSDNMPLPSDNEYIKHTREIDDGQLENWIESGDIKNEI